jgi:hypothetical protein
VRHWRYTPPTGALALGFAAMVLVIEILLYALGQA